MRRREFRRLRYQADDDHPTGAQAIRAAAASTTYAQRMGRFILFRTIAVPMLAGLAALPA